jgi:hypothetical protein
MKKRNVYIYSVLLARHVLSKNFKPQNFTFHLIKFNGTTIYIFNVKLPNLELQAQGISYREREKDRKREPLCNIVKLNRILGLPKKCLGQSGGGGGADPCKARVAQLVLFKLPNFNLIWYIVMQNIVNHKFIIILLLSSGFWLRDLG